MKISTLNTPIGEMVAIGDQKALYLLEFVDSKGLDHHIKRIEKNFHSPIVSGSSLSIDSIQKELGFYFAGKLNTFKTPIHYQGSPFTISVWEELLKIPYGETRSYLDIAEALNLPTHFRAAARANGANQLAILIPCHRVINKNGKLGGYAGGLDKKIWLLNHEKKHTNNR